MHESRSATKSRIPVFRGKPQTNPERLLAFHPPSRIVNRFVGNLEYAKSYGTRALVPEIVRRKVLYIEKQKKLGKLIQTVLTEQYLLRNGLYIISQHFDSVVQIDPPKPLWSQIEVKCIKSTQSVFPPEVTNVGTTALVQYVDNVVQCNRFGESAESDMVNISRNRQSRRRMSSFLTPSEVSKVSIMPSPNEQPDIFEELKVERYFHRKSCDSARLDDSSSTMTFIRDIISERFESILEMSSDSDDKLDAIISSEVLSSLPKPAPFGPTTTLNIAIDHTGPTNFSECKFVDSEIMENRPSFIAIENAYDSFEEFSQFNSDDAFKSGRLFSYPGDAPPYTDHEDGAGGEQSAGKTIMDIASVINLINKTTLKKKVKTVHSEESLTSFLSRKSLRCQHIINSICEDKDEKLLTLTNMSRASIASSWTDSENFDAVRNITMNPFQLLFYNLKRFMKRHKEICTKVG